MDTPRTDAAEYDTGLRLESEDADDVDMVVPSGIARQLEREVLLLREFVRTGYGSKVIAEERILEIEQQAKEDK